MVFFFEGRFCNTPLSELTEYPNERQQEADENSITKLLGMIQLSPMDKADIGNCISWDY